jgi:glucokinase
LQWANLPLADLIAARLPLRTYIVNRANAAALGERWYGAGRGRENLVYINIGTGIRAGIIMRGELYLGSNGSAGEIGHITLAPDGPPCTCGKRGCLEALAATQAMVEHYRLRLRAQADWPGDGRQDGKSQTALADLRDLLAAAHTGDETALNVMLEAAGYIGLAVANLTSIFNPERVILGGLAGQAPTAFVEAITSAAHRYAIPIPWKTTDIVVAELGQEAVAIGAAALLLSDFLQPTHLAEASPAAR